MKRAMKKVAGIALVAALVVTSSGYNTATTQAAPKAKKIVMNKKSVKLEVGKTFKLKVKKVTPKKAGKAVSYKSNKPKIAKVSKKGKITAVAEGNAKVTVTSKKNKKAKTVVKVTVIPADNANVTDNTNTAAPISTAKAEATTAPKASPTADVKPTESVATQKPARTARPTKEPTPVPTPRFEKPETTAAPVQKLSFAEGAFYNENADGAEITRNEDGTMTVKFTQQWAALNFYIPDDAQSYFSTYKSAVITYKSSKTGNFTEENNGDLGHALFDADHSENPESQEAGKHPDWGRKLVTSADYVTKVFNVTSECAGGCIRGFQVFNPNEMAEGDSITITIKSIIFYDEEKPEDFVPDDESDTPPETSADPEATQDPEATEAPEEPQKPNLAEPYEVDLSKVSTVTDGIPGDPAKVTYNEETKSLDAVMPGMQGFIVRSPITESKDDYKYVEITYTQDGEDVGIFAGQYDAGTGQGATGWSPDTNITKLDKDKETTLLLSSDDYLEGAPLGSIKIFNYGGAANISIKSITFYKDGAKSE